MTRSQMIETVARKTGFPESQVETTMDAMFDQIAECLRADEKVTIAGFGRFEMRPRKPKAYTNPKTKVSSRLESTSIPGFKASGRFKQRKLPAPPLQPRRQWKKLHNPYPRRTGRTGVRPFLQRFRGNPWLCPVRTHMSSGRDFFDEPAPDAEGLFCFPFSMLTFWVRRAILI